MTESIRFTIEVLLFTAVGTALGLGSLLLGKLLRPKNPGGLKDEIYECGEPTVGPAWVQFDLRFYVVALVFIIFEVEVAFLFPWAIVFGKANRLRSETTVRAAADPSAARATLTELGVRDAGLTLPSDGDPADTRALAGAADRLALAAMIDMGVFFAVLLVAFAYVWSRGDLDWVRAVARSPTADLQDVSTSVSSPSLR